jgi:uncharacterized protein YaeQ
MALRSTIYKAELAIADIDRGYYADHALTLARHPSETEERLMVRALAFAMHADERLALAGDISTDGEPALWRRDDTGVIEQWIEVGLPDERLLRRAAGRADEVIVLAYGGRKAEAWWQDNARDLAKLRNLTVWFLPPEECEALTALAERSMRLGCTHQEGHWLISGPRGSAELIPLAWQQPAR